MKVSLYFHIPFCTKKCPYCHFYVIPNQAKHRASLKKALALEWERKVQKLENKEIETIYFGGGTPALYDQYQDIFEKLKLLPLAPDCEITIEANPEELTEQKLEYFLSLGINRLSLGVQSLDDRSLLTLERIHSAEKAKQAILSAKKVGFTNISIDLMYDLPGQTEESWNYTLYQLDNLPIQHLSLYNLTIEPHTSFHKRKVQIPQGEISLRFLLAALKKLTQIGLERYEISAFAKPGHESRHNLGYWNGRPFLGFGPSAFSYWEGKRFRNIAHLNRYHAILNENQSPVDFEEELPYPANLKERLAIQIRVKKGADLTQFEPLPLETQTTIQKLKEQNLLKQNGSYLQLTERGTLFYDTVASELI